MNTAVIPNELPPSRLVYVLTTSEGRDKLFKLLQYTLLAFVWTLQCDNLVPATNASRDYWIRRFTGNLSTLRFGRCLFRLGRWLITVVYVQMSVRYLVLLLRARSTKTVGAPSRMRIFLAALLVLRSCASVARSVVRDALFLADTGFSPLLRLSPVVAAVAERAQQLLWIIVSITDCVLIEWRLSLPGWVPDLASLRCGCDPGTVFPVGVSRFRFAPTDLDFGCPYPLVPSFFSALEPTDMPLICVHCGHVATDASNTAMTTLTATTAATATAPASAAPPITPTTTSGALLVPNMVRRMFEYSTIIGAHGNLRDMLLLRLKSFCELVMSLTLTASNVRAASSFDLTSGGMPQVFTSTTIAGLLSAMISVHRVWEAAT